MKRKSANMFRKEAKELIDLAWRVSDETDYPVRCTLSSSDRALFLEIRDETPGENTCYGIFFNNEYLVKQSKEECKKVKEHLLRLLEDGKN